MVHNIKVRQVVQKVVKIQSNVQKIVKIQPAIKVENIITEQQILDTLGYNPENVANKTITWGITLSDSKYPSEKLTKEAIDEAQKAIAGIITINLTTAIGSIHTVNILPEYSGKVLDITANLDDEVIILVGNDIELNQPITIMKKGQYTQILRAANSDIVIEANDVVDVGGIDEVDISFEVFSAVQILKKANNVIRGFGI